MTELLLVDPAFLLLALLLPIVVWLRRRSGGPALRFAPGALFEDLPRTWRVRLLPLPPVLQAAGLLLVILALARPVHRTRLPHETRGIDILLCLDVSSSMAANDMDGRRTRLDVARSAAARFIAGRPDDRIGLVGFARYPDLICPPTLDHAALQQFLAGLERVQADGPEDATGIGAAVARAAQVLGGGTTSRVVILITDGEENVAQADTPDEIAPVHAAQLCRELGVRAYAIVAGIGSPDRRGGFVPLDTRQVRRLAEISGGAFFTAQDATALATVYGHIDALEKAALAEPRYRVRDRFVPFLVAALALLGMSWITRATLLQVLP